VSYFIHKSNIFILIFYSLSPIFSELRILTVFATTTESGILKEISDLYPGRDGFSMGGSQVSVLVTGIGGVQTAWSMKQWLCENQRPDLIINAGIAGSFKDEIKKGDVVMPVSDCFADMGIETGDRYLTLAETGLVNPDEFPFSNGILHCENKYSGMIGGIAKPVRAITVNTTSGTETTIEKLKNKFNPDIETMEGATFFYICARENISFLALRAISNMVVPGRTDKWEITLALDNLAEKMKEVFKILL
jgi:futalosine hydrolase